MTYCVGFCLKDGLVLLSDTRTNAGPDNIANFGKLNVAAPGDRVIAMMTSGNLAVTQAVAARVLEGAGIGAEGAVRNTDDRQIDVRSGPTRRRRGAQGVQLDHLRPERAEFLLRRAGHSGRPDRRPAGCECSTSTRLAISSRRRLRRRSSRLAKPNTARPILDRVAHYDTPLDDAVKLALISMDSTLRSNFSVGLPADLLVYRRDTQRVAVQERINEDNEYFRTIRENWSDALRKAYRELPAPPWMS